MMGSILRGPIRMAAGTILLLGACLAGSQLAAQAGASTQSEEQAQQLADILDRHSSLDPATLRAGAAVYQGNCAACHDNAIGRAPPASMMASFSPEAVMRVLTVGAMKEQGATLEPAQKRAVAQFVTGRALGEERVVAPLMCADNSDWFDLSQPPPHLGWGLDANNGHWISDDVAGLNRGNVGTLKLKWAIAFPGVINARAQPAIAGGAIFVGSENGTVYALDPETGCAHWTYASGPVRMGLVIDSWEPGDTEAAPRIYFGDMFGRASAIDARTGELVWQRVMDPHPSATLTASPSLNAGTLYFPVASLEEPAAAAPTYECCTFRGSLVALDAVTGAEKWRAHMVGEPGQTGVNVNGVKQFGPSGAAIWSTPLVDPARGQVYVNTGDNYSAPATELSDAIVALDLDTGKINWTYQALEGDAWNVSCGFADGSNCPEDAGPDHDFGAPPVMAIGKDGTSTLFAGQKSGVLFALDPDKGTLRWSKRVGRGGVFGGIHFGLSAANGRVIVPMSDFPDGGNHATAARPGLYSIDATTGDYVWSVASEDVCGGKRFCAPGYGTPVTSTDQLVLAGSTDGHLRIYDGDTGELLWDMDTDREYQTVNGSVAKGGSMSGGAAPIVWNGKVIVSSGYGSLGKLPGNVMLVFEAE